MGKYLEYGRRVKIIGLKGHSNYNGQMGIINKEYNYETERYEIRLENSERVISVRPKNLDVTSENKSKMFRCIVSDCDCSNPRKDNLYEYMCMCGHQMDMHKYSKENKKKFSNPPKKKKKKKKKK